MKISKNFFCVRYDLSHVVPFTFPPQGCELNPKIVYTEFSAVVRKQKEILKKLIEKKQNQIRKIHPGLTCFRDGSVKEIPVESIPGIVEAGYVPPDMDNVKSRNTRNSDDRPDPDQLYNTFKVRKIS